MSDDWATVVAMVRASGGNPGGVVARARECGIGPVEVEAALWVAADKVATDEDDDTPHDFTDHAATPPGSFDLRVFEQDEIWIDVLRVPHVITDIGDDYVRNLLAWHLQFVEGNYTAYCRLNPTALVMEPLEWLLQTPLMSALRHEAARRGL